MPQVSLLKESLNYLHVNELKSLCEQLKLSSDGKKMELIIRITCYMETGEKLLSPKYPKNSCAEPRKRYEIEKNALMLKGEYKNDLKTRMFFKKIIGDHFHFTAFGIDWLNNRWMEGNPPTYQEFADMWDKEYQKRKQLPASPKAEWAYINFVQNFLKINPNATRKTITDSWEAERSRHKTSVMEYLKQDVTSSPY